MTGAGTGDKRGYSWPPFEDGHERSVVHGSRSERLIGPRAEEIERRLLADESTPDHLRRPEFAGAVTAWARAQAVADQVFDYLSEQDMAVALAEITREASEEEASKGKVRRRSVSRRTVSALDAWFRASAHAATLRRDLGLSPLAAGRLAKDLSASRWYQSVSPLDKALAQIERDRQAAIEGGDDG